MQAYAEGLALLRAKKELNLDVAAIAESWRHGTVIRSWLLDLTAEFLAEDAKLESIAPRVASILCRPQCVSHVSQSTRFPNPPWWL